MNTKIIYIVIVTEKLIIAIFNETNFNILTPATIIQTDTMSLTI